MPARVRRAVTAADVQAAVEERRGVLTVPARALVTPLAHDLARERGIELVPVATSAPAGERRGSEGRLADGRDPDRGPDDVESQVRSIVASLLATGEVDGGRGRVHHVPASTARDLPRFAHPGPGPDQEVRARDVISAADGAPMAVGFLTLTRGEFPWTLGYDEIQYVIEGELHVTVPEGRVVGHPGDVLYVPRGTSITFATPTWAKFLYVTFPADWETA